MNFSLDFTERVSTLKSFFFGPVLSRRLGYSLGIDILPEKKTCTFDCLYCELGKARQVKPVHRFTLFADQIDRFKRELKSILTSYTIISSLTFAGYQGEGTLNTCLGEFLQAARLIRDETANQDIPLSILTNSSTMHLKDVCENLFGFDQVIAKLDAGNQRIFEKINRPHPSVPALKEIIHSLIQFRESLLKPRRLILQTLLIQENASEQNIDDLINAFNLIKPSGIQLYTIARPPAYVQVKRLESSRLEQIGKKIGKRLHESIQLRVY